MARLRRTALNAEAKGPFDDLGASTSRPGRAPNSATGDMGVEEPGPIALQGNSLSRLHATAQGSRPSISAGGTLRSCPNHMVTPYIAEAATY